MKKLIFIIGFMFIYLINGSVAHGMVPTIYGDEIVKSGKTYFIKNIDGDMYLGEGINSNKQEIVKSTKVREQSQRWQLNVEEVDDNGVMTITFVLGDEGLFLTEEKGSYTLKEYRGTPDQLFKVKRVNEGNIYKIFDYKNSPVNVGDGVKDSSWEFIELDEKKSHREIIAHWAPDIYQDFNTVNKDFYNYDYITNFNFDGDWNGFNNWENSANEEFKKKGRYAYVYASIQETPSHYFLTYNFFHPRDVGGTALAVYAIDSHENDLEGALYAIEKDGTPYGKIQLIYTQAHGKHDTYGVNDIRFRDGDKGSGKVELFSSSNGTAVGTHGHSVHMWSNQYPGGIKYINKATGGFGDIGNSEMAEFKTDEDDIYKECQYKILSLDELWKRRYDIGNGKTFKGFGSFGSDASGFKDHLGQTMKGSANAPWSWDKGLWISDPAFFMDSNDSFRTMNHKYTFNKYVTHKITVEKIRANVYKDSKINSKKRADIFPRVQVDGTKYIDIGDYKKSNVDNGVWHDFFFGAEEAEGNAQYTERINSLFITRNQKKDVIFEVRDRDTGNDDSMGIIKYNIPRGQSIYFESNTDNKEAGIKGELHTR